jgi:hypothetical protein
MHKIALFILVGLFSSVAFADVSVDPANGRRDTIEYKCKFEGFSSCANCGDERTSCWVEGFLCNEGGDNKDYRRCRDSNDPIKIKCSDGFRLESRDVAIELDNGTLWINAERHESIATIRVEDFFDDHRALDDHRGDNEFRRVADLMVSEKEGQANRFEGSCTFERRGRPTNA